MPAVPVTGLLVEWCNGDQEALNRLLPEVYQELRRLARSQLRGYRPDHTIEPTALVHEAYLRLSRQAGVAVKSRAHFYAIVAHVMRCVLVDYARRRSSAKRQGGWIRVSTEEIDDRPENHDLDFVALNDALTSLAEIDPQKSRIVELRFFGGLAVDDIGKVLGISPRTVAREWVMARAWLYGQVGRCASA
jgi:RNA polymerase sigma factor (TIGR02999 family)